MTSSALYSFLCGVRYVCSGELFGAAVLGLEKMYTTTIVLFLFVTEQD
jgi:hypothetical protein